MNWQLATQALPFIFLASLPGRTTFVMFLMAMRRNPWGIFLGSALAFAVQSVIAVLIGKVLVFFPKPWLEIGAGLLFLWFAFRYWTEKTTEEKELSKTNQQKGSKLTDSIRSSFLIVFVAEWGDVSQLSIAALAAKKGDALTVFVCALAALWSIAGLVIFLGSHAKKAVHPDLIRKTAAVVFGGVGIYLIISGVRS